MPLVSQTPSRPLAGAAVGELVYKCVYGCACAHRWCVHAWTHVCVHTQTYTLSEQIPVYTYECICTHVCASKNVVHVRRLLCACVCLLCRRMLMFVAWLHLKRETNNEVNGSELESLLLLH